MGLYVGAAGTQKGLAGASWQRPGDASDAVRVYTLPHGGDVTVTGTVHKDIYHIYGDGVRVNVLLGNQQLWPQRGWQTIGANDITGKSMEMKTPVKKGDKLYFVANRNADAVDDDLVWDPCITYEGDPPRPEKAPVRTVVDDHSTVVKYSGQGWQASGVTPWGGEQGYLPGRRRGTLTISGTPGDKLTLRFRGTGIEVIGDTGSDRGIASVALDGKQVGMIDTFVPENAIWSVQEHPSSIREAARVTILPAIPLWGTRSLTDGEHTMELSVTGRKNDASTGTFIGIDALVVLGGSAIDSEAK
jgi:hypothetical protein